MNIHPLRKKIQEFKYFNGQSAIFASRANAKNFKFLWDSKVKVYSQFGEDGIIDYLSESLNLSKPRMLEIGAGDFNECNSRWLAEFRSSPIYAVDIKNDLVKSIQKSGLLWKTHLFSSNEWVTPENISEIVQNAIDVLGGVDIFSLDLDGNDYWILEAAEISMAKIVIVEYNPLFGPNHKVTVPREDTFDRSNKHHSWLYYGASLKAFIDLLEIRGFSFMGTNRVGNNAFFVQSNLSGRFSLLPRSDLSIFTDWPIRDSRSKSGQLNYLSENRRIVEMGEMPVLDLTANSIISVKDLFSQNKEI